jgi:hypothetical protein
MPNTNNHKKSLKLAYLLMIEGVDVKTGDSFIRIVDFNSALDLKVGHRFE